MSHSTHVQVARVALASKTVINMKAKFDKNTGICANCGIEIHNHDHPCEYYINNKTNNVKTASTTRLTIQGIEKTTAKVFIEHMISAIFTMSPTMIEYLIHGATLMKSQWAREVKGLDPYNVVSVIAKLFDAYIAPRVIKPGEDLLEIHVLQGDAEILMKLLELRMQHCEEERANGSPNFNPDTYIAMKLLWFDMKEFIMGTIIPYPADEPRIRTPKGHDVPEVVKQHHRKLNEDVEQGEGEDGNRASGAHSYGGHQVDQD